MKLYIKKVSRLFRITQSYLVNILVTQLQEKNWEILYQNYVNARRSGGGSQGVIYHCFKIIFDQFPDIVAVKGGTLLLIQVDLTFKEKYVNKLKKFKLQQDKLFNCIRNKLGLNLTTLELGVAFERKPRVSMNKLSNLHIWIYNLRSKSFKKIQ